jgi:hypothetical protein
MMKGYYRHPKGIVEAVEMASIIGAEHEKFGE